MKTAERIANRELSVRDCLREMRKTYPKAQLAAEADTIAQDLRAMDRRVAAPMPHFCAAQALALATGAGVKRCPHHYAVELRSRREAVELRATAHTLLDAGRLSASEAQAVRRWVGVAECKTRLINFGDSIETGILEWVARIAGVGSLVGATAGIMGAMVLVGGVLPTGYAGWAASLATLVGGGVVPATYMGGAAVLAAIVGGGVIGFYAPLALIMGPAYALWRWTPLGDCVGW